jgi:heterodisulfide reductase subunit B
MNEMDIKYLDETDQTSCTAWTYHGSGIGNIESLAAVFLRNFHQAYVSAKAQGLPEGYYYPLVHCGTSFGNYKEVRGYLMHSAKLRERVKKILGKLGRLVDGKLLIPEEVVHYSEWLHVMRDEIAKRQVIDCSHIRATVHPACHVYKMVPEDAIYDDNTLGGNRVAVTTSVLEALGTQVIDYRTWYDCCGFGFRHIISEREFTRSFAIDRKIRVAVEEAQADMMVGHDTGCITTLDKNQWIGAAAGKPVDLPVLADCQFAALVCGAHPYKIVQSHWHASSTESLMEKLGIDWEKKKAEFEAYLKDVEAGKGEMLYDPRLMITSGPGFKPQERLK